MARKTVFYLGLMEGVPVAYPQKCWVLKRFENIGKRDYFLIRVRPQILYYEADQQIAQIDEVIVTARYAGKTIAKIKECPLYVNILKPPSPIKGDGEAYELIEDDLKIIALGVVYTSVDDLWQGAHRRFEQLTEKWWVKE